MVKDSKSLRPARKDARLLDLVFAHSIDNLVLLDRDYNFVRVSRSYAKACGRPVSDFIGRNHFELYPSPLKEEFDRAREAKAVYSRSARPFVFPDHPEWGVTYWDLGLVPLLDAGGAIEFFLFTLKDVTQAVRADQALRESEEKFSKAFHCNPTAMAIRRESDDTIVEANEAFVRLFGYSRKQLIGRTIAEIGFYARPEDRPPTPEAYLGPLKGTERRMLTKGGASRLVKIAVDRITLKNQSCRLASFVDITESRKAEEALRELTAVAQDRARRLEAMAGALAAAEQRERRRLAAMLHDHLQQQLSAVAMNLGILRGAKGLDAEACQSLRQAYDLVQQAIRDSRSLSREISPPVPYQAGFGSVLEWLAGQMRAMHRLEVELSLPRRLPKIADSTQAFLFGAVRELLFNTVKHARVPAATVAVRVGRRTLEIEVADSGAGFDPGKMLEEVSGMGLISIKESLAALHGSLDIDSRPGEGSRIRICVPLPRRGRAKSGTRL